MGGGKKKRKRNHQRDFNVIIDLGKVSVHDLCCDDPRAKAPTTNTAAEEGSAERGGDRERGSATGRRHVSPKPLPIQRKPNALQETIRAFSNDSTRYFHPRINNYHPKTHISPKPKPSPRITKAPNALTGNHPSVLFRRRHTMFHPVIQLFSSTKALPRSHNNAKESPTSLHIWQQLNRMVNSIQQGSPSSTNYNPRCHNISSTKYILITPRAQDRG